jgi:plasmid maintenance system killer protein
MDFEFSTGKLRKEMSEEKAMNRAYGNRAKPLRLRLAVLKRAACLADVPKGPPDRCHQLSQDRAGQLAVVIKDNWRLVFKPNHDPVPELPGGGLDERAVTKIMLLEVVDYH